MSTHLASRDAADLPADLSIGLPFTCTAAAVTGQVPRVRRPCPCRTPIGLPLTVPRAGRAVSGRLVMAMPQRGISGGMPLRPLASRIDR